MGFGIPIEHTPIYREITLYRHKFLFYVYQITEHIKYSQILLFSDIKIVFPIASPQSCELQQSDGNNIHNRYTNNKMQCKLYVDY